VRLSLPLRIFLYHFVFIVALGGVTALGIRESFQWYAEDWKREVRTFPSENLFNPMASEVARSLLLELERGVPESAQRKRRAISEGLDAVVPALSSVEELTILDADGHVQYMSPASNHDLSIDDPEIIARLEAVSRSTADGDRRLGAVLLYLRPDPEIADALERGGEGGIPEAPAGEKLIGPLALEVAREILARPEAGPREHEAQVERYRREVSSGLKRILPSLGSVESVMVVDVENRIQFFNSPEEVDLKFTGEDSAWRFDVGTAQRREVTLPSGRPGMEVVFPIFRKEHATGPEQERLGSLVLAYRPDPDLSARHPELLPPVVPPRAYTRPLILFLGVAVVGGVLIAALSGLPVRRLEKALEEFRARDFKGRLDPKRVGLEKDLGSAIRAINELGGRLQALDARGRERESLLATLSQSLEEAMIALDPSGTPVAWNPAAARLLVGPRDPDSEDGDPDAETIQTALGRSPDLGFALAHSETTLSREVEVVRGDGTRVPAQAALVPFEMRPGVTGTMLLLRDLATLRTVEAHLLEAGRFAVLAHLAAGLAHEIRNPLHSIQINATAAEQYIDSASAGDGADPMLASLETIKNETGRLTGLLNNYLGMVRPEKEMATVDLRELAHRVVQLVQYTAGQSGVEIRVEGEQVLPPVRGIPDRLQQAILNLVLNAIQAMPDGGTLKIRTEVSDKGVQLTVSDTGPGLAKGLAADQLFDTRMTTKPGGTGLGLPLVRMIVEAHGGSVWYRAAPDQGASFTLVLPTES
jgi:signal transduction histidine kinase